MLTSVCKYIYILCSGVKRSQDKENVAPKKRKTNTKGMVMYVVQYTLYVLRLLQGHTRLNSCSLHTLSNDLYLCVQCRYWESNSGGLA